MKGILSKMTLAACAMPLFAMGMNLTFTGGTAKDPIRYKCGEEIRFEVILVDKDNDCKPVAGRKLVWTRRGDDGKTVTGEGDSTNPLVVTTSMDKPGFVRLTVNYIGDDGKPVTNSNTAAFDGSAGVDVANIPAYPPPADFEEFWKTELEKLYGTPYEVKLKPVEQGDKRVKIVQFELDTYEGQRKSTGLIGMPADAGEKSLKMEISVFGYGFGPISINPKDIMANGGRLVLAIARHGEDPRQSKEYYDNLKANEMKGFCFRNNGSRYTSDYYHMLTRDLRAIQYAKTLPQWNGKDMSVKGGSMGGYQALAIAALEKSVTSCGAYVPWSVELSGGAKFGRMTGWRPGWTESLGYFDAANFATMITCPIDLGIGLGDYVCPPSGQMVLFRNLKSTKKHMGITQNTAHGSIRGVKSQTSELNAGDF